MSIVSSGLPVRRATLLLKVAVVLPKQEVPRTEHWLRVFENWGLIKVGICT